MSDPNNPFPEGSIPPPPGSTPPPPASPGGGFTPPAAPPGGGFTPPPPGGGYVPPPPGGGFAPPPGMGGAGGAGGPGTIDIGTVINWSIAKYQQHAQILLGLAAVVAAVNFIGGFITVKLQERTVGGISITDDGVVRIADNFWSGVFGSMLLGIAFGILGWILTIGITRAAIKVTRGETPSFNDLLEGTFTVNYIVTSIVVGFLTFAGLVLCVLPGLLVMFFMMMAPIHALATGEGVGDAISRSIAIVKANVVPIIVLVVLSMAVAIIAALFGGIGGAVVSAIIQLLLLPLSTLAAAAAYRQGNGEALAA